MSLRGQLSDVPLVDILQFIKFSGRSGTLVLERDGQEVAVGLHEGNIVSVRGTAVARIGQYLLASGAITSSVLRDALDAQCALDPPPPLGAWLHAHGCVSRAQLLAAFRAQVEETILEVVSWSRGSFRFDLDHLTPVDDLALSPNDVADMNLNTQHVLLEAARLLDEGGHAAQQPPASSPLHGPASQGGRVAEPASGPQGFGPTSGDGGRMRVQVVSADATLAPGLEEALMFESGYVAAVDVAEAALPTPHGAAALVVVDVRSAGGHGLASLRRIRGTSAHSAIIALVERAGDLAAAYEAGASSVVTGPVEALASCVRAVERQQRHLSPDRLFAEGLTASFAKLRRLIGEVRTGVVTAVESLSLLSLISESVERAVVFLVLPRALTVMGAFGSDGEGRTLAERTRQLRLGLGEAGILGRAVADREVHCVQSDDADVPAALTARIGRPHSGCCAVLPVVSGDRVVAVVYVDNGAKNWPLEEVEFLELAVAQMGMAFENQLLRRALEKAAVKPSVERERATPQSGVAERVRPPAPPAHSTSHAPDASPARASAPNPWPRMVPGTRAGAPAHGVALRAGSGLAPRVPGRTEVAGPLGLERLPTPEGTPSA